MRQFLLLLGTIFFLSCSAGDKLGDQYVYWVNSTMASCVGMAPAKCLQVQKADQPDPSGWKSFHATIKGFNYEPGYIYKIIVKEQNLDTDTLPADAASIEYSLLEILEKRQDMRFALNHSWVLLQIKAVDVQAAAASTAAPRLEIHVGDMRYMGNDGCNNFTGGIIELVKHRIRFGVAAGTRMMCPDMSIPDLFNSTLPDVLSWEINDKMLHLFDVDREELMQFKKAD